jgi:hypothetical protein
MILARQDARLPRALSHNWERAMPTNIVKPAQDALAIDADEKREP